MDGDAVLRSGAILEQIGADVASGRPEFAVDGETLRVEGGALGRLLVPPGVAVTVLEAGDLRAGGCDAGLDLHAVRGDLRLEGLQGTVRVADVAGDVRAEGVADLRILGACRGDLRFADGGRLEASSVAGDLKASSAGEVAVGRVGGDLAVERVSGPVAAERVDGDARLSRVRGAASVGSVAGDLRALDCEGGLDAPRVHGDAALTGVLGPGAVYHFSADGDAEIGLRADASVRLALRAGGRLRSDVQLSPATDGTQNFTASVGDGDASLEGSCRGSLKVAQAGASGKGWEARTRSDPFGDLNNLGERIRQQVTASLAAAGISVEGGEPHPGGRPPRPPRAPRPPAPPERWRAPAPADRPVTEEEMVVLEMLRGGKITPEEAEVLLRALG
jgi:hypothetical protein